MVVGVPSATCTTGGTFNMTFDSAAAVKAYLGGGGTAGALTACFLDPTTSTTTGSGGFGSQVTAVQLNVDFNDAGLMPRGVSKKFSSLVICNTGYSCIDGKTIAQVLGLAETALGNGGLPSCTPTMDFGTFNTIIADLNLSFDDNGTQFCPSTWATTNLFFNNCPG